MHPLQFHELLQWLFFFVSIMNKKFHIWSRHGKMLGLSPGINISVSSKSGHSTFVLSTIVVIIVNAIITVSDLLSKA